MLQSEFQHVLRTNYAPTEAEARKIKDFCIAPEVEVQKLELEASRLQAALNAVRSKQDEYKDAIAAHLALLSPIRRLSPELLQAIFAFCIAEFPIMHVSEAPLLLGRICKNWRDVVYNTAELWSGVHVIVPSRLNPVHQLLRQIALREWIDRSGDGPLRISFDANDRAAEIDNFLDLIVPQFPRCQQMILNVSESHSERLEDYFSGTALPRLRSVALTYTHPQSSHGSPPNSSQRNPLRLLEGCTDLHCLSVRILMFGSQLRGTLPICIAPSLQELDLHYTGSDLKQLIMFMELCQNLRICRIQSSFELNTATQPTSLIILPALEHLSTAIHSIPVDPNLGSTRPALTFLDHLVTPRLLHLNLMNVFDVKEISLSLTNFLVRSSCPLRTLSLRLRDDRRDLGPILSSLGHATNLTELRIARWYTGLEDLLMGPCSEEHDAFLLGLAYTASPTNYCPNLTHLALENYITGINLDSLLILIKSRLEPPPGCARLQTLDLEQLEVPCAAPEVQEKFKASLLQAEEELCVQDFTILLPNQVKRRPLLSPHQVNESDDDEIDG